MRYETRAQKLKLERSEIMLTTKTIEQVKDKADHQENAVSDRIDARKMKDKKYYLENREKVKRRTATYLSAYVFKSGEKKGLPIPEGTEVHHEKGRGYILDKHENKIAVITRSGQFAARHIARKSKNKKKSKTKSQVDRKAKKDSKDSKGKKRVYEYVYGSESDEEYGKPIPADAGKPRLYDKEDRNTYILDKEGVARTVITRNAWNKRRLLAEKKSVEDQRAPKRRRVDSANNDPQTVPVHNLPEKLVNLSCDKFYQKSLLSSPLLFKRQPEQNSKLTFHNVTFPGVEAKESSRAMEEQDCMEFNEDMLCEEISKYLKNS